MRSSRILETYVDYLKQGKRQDCRDQVLETLNNSKEPQSVYFDLFWPAMQKIEELYREDRINLATEHMATRINRSLVAQVQRDLPRDPPNGRGIIVTCADGESEELGAQMCADLFEARGWNVYFVGGGVPCDEILTLVGQVRPDILLIYGMTSQGVPGVRAVIDLIREVGVNPTMNIMVTGGVFNRAEDLWKEINADLTARDIGESLTVAEEARPRAPEVRVPGAPKRRRRRRRPPLLAAARN